MPLTARRGVAAGVGDLVYCKVSSASWAPVTNSQVFDHVLRSRENYSKWDYVRENPVRAGLTSDADDWPWQGEIELLML
jgi:hypothetical protein